jgi:hypothetical protein
MLGERRRRISACHHQPECVVAAAVWHASERDLLAATLERAWQGRALPVPLIADYGVRLQILCELQGLNHIIEVYAQGVTPRYPEIDGPSVALGTPRARSDIADAVALSDAEPGTELDRSLGLALALLDVNDRDDAAAFEPLDVRYNELPLARSRHVDWAHFPYTAIIVPGSGPDDLATSLSATGKLRVCLAAVRFFAGAAPYVIVTGGTVHPRGTRFAEALEMRQALIDRYGVPADSIVVEPYARHTTTNLRNAIRRLAALGAPFDRDTLIVTDSIQSQKIESAAFAARNQEELGYQPGFVGARLSPTELAYRPALISLRVDPMDPLDP